MMRSTILRFPQESGNLEADVYMNRDAVIVRTAA